METAYYIFNHDFSVFHWFSLVIIFTVSLVVTMMIVKRKELCVHERSCEHEKMGCIQAVFISLLITYIFFILLITLVVRTPAAEPKAKLIPFWSWYEVIVNHNKGLFAEIILNVILFVPVGMLMRLLHIPLRRVVIFSLIFSLGIEVTQYFTCRGLMEWVDDVFGNTSGGTVGWFTGRAVMRIWPSRQQKYKKQKGT